MKKLVLPIIGLALTQITQAALIVDVNPANSAPNIATAADFLPADSALSAATVVSTIGGGAAWETGTFSFDGLTLTTGGGRAGNARNGNAASGYTTDQAILGGSVLTNGSDPLLTLDITGLAALAAGTEIVFTIYGIGDNVGQDSTFDATFAGTTSSLDTVFNTVADPSDATGSSPFVQFTFTTDTVNDSISVVSAPLNNTRTFINGFSVSVTPIPEPSSTLLLGLSAMGFLVRRRR